jgi:hypothetical protein
MPAGRARHHHAGSMQASELHGLADRGDAMSKVQQSRMMGERQHILGRQMHVHVDQAWQHEAGLIVTLSVDVVNDASAVLQRLSATDHTWPCALAMTMIKEGADDGSDRTQYTGHGRRSDGGGRSAARVSAD